MKKPEIPDDEELRLKSLRSLNILDTPPEERFDRIVRMARRMFDVPCAFISLIDADRQWFKASIGLEFDEILRDDAICAHTIVGNDTLIIHDAAADNRFADGPLVLGDTNARFYASCPLTLENGSTIGTLCVLDDHSRIFDEESYQLLRDLAASVEREFSIMQSAITDDLTGIYNRKGFLLAANHCLNLCVRQDLPATLAYIFARLGADEFVALFINAPGEAAESIMTRFRQKLRNSPRSHRMGYHSSFHYGVVEYDFRQHKLIETLIDDGAAAMHASIQADQKDVTAA
jgi:GGDEF domain-containing protein